MKEERERWEKGKDIRERELEK
jgi:hypothetical protein